MDLFQLYRAKRSYLLLNELTSGTIIAINMRMTTTAIKIFIFMSFNHLSKLVRAGKIYGPYI